MLSGRAAQLTATKARSRRGLPSWMARANSSLPVPLSPSSRTVALDGATCWTISRVFRMGTELPMMRRSLRTRPSSSRRARFSVTSVCFSSARRTPFTISMRLKGFVTKS